MGAGALQTNLQESEEEPLQPERYALPSAEEAAEEEGTPDLPATLRRIKEVARVLDRFKELRDPGRSRSEYTEQVGAVPIIYVPLGNVQIFNGQVMEERGILVGANFNLWRRLLDMQFNQWQK